MFKFLKRIRDILLVKVLWRRHKIGRRFHAGIRVRLLSRNPIIIGDDFYIGRDSLIETDACIGNDSIIAAGSVITKDVEPYCIYAGVPARKITDRFDSVEDKNKHISLYYNRKN
jgi:acetyltransferase-like isoleucine patch superfamily enzyme